jgi:hypothetical protein
MEEGVTWAAALATWALVHMQGDVLIGVTALRSRTACHFLRPPRLVESVGMVVDLFVGAPLMRTLGTGVNASMECVVLLLSSIRGLGPLRGVYTLGTHAMLGLAEDIVVSLKWSCRACK